VKKNLKPTWSSCDVWACFIIGKA